LLFRHHHSLLSLSCIPARDAPTSRAATFIMTQHGTKINPPTRTETIDKARNAT